MTSKSISAVHKRTPSENWDEDFDFQPEIDKEKSNRSSYDRRSIDEVIQSSPNFTRQKIPIQMPERYIHTSFSEAGPSRILAGPPQVKDQNACSTQDKFAQKHVRASSTESVSLENWDDDFEDRPDSPKRKGSRKVHSRRSSPTEEENWDDDLRLSVDDSSPTAMLVQHAMQVDSSDEDDDDSIHGLELGFSDREEDRTVTGRSRPAISDRLTLPPIPPLPNLSNIIIPDTNTSTPTPFPRSPTLSTFSIPYSGRESTTYGSTAHLTLYQTHSSSRLSKLPPSPPVHKERERRRLRKKSRPSYLDGNIMELDDRPEVVFQAPTKSSLATPRPISMPSVEVLRPSTPENLSINQIPTPISTGISQAHISPSAVSTIETGSPTNNKTPLLTRIGSVKRWAGTSGLRRKRASTGPAELQPTTSAQVSVVNIISPPASPPQARRGSRFFRVGGGPASENPEIDDPSHKAGNERHIDSPKTLKWTNKLGLGNSTAHVRQDLTPVVNEGLRPRRASIKHGDVTMSADVDATEEMLEKTPRRPHSQRSANRSAFPRYASGPNIPNAEKESSIFTEKIRSFSTFSAKSHISGVQTNFSEDAATAANIGQRPRSSGGRLGHFIESYSPKKKESTKQYPEVTLRESELPPLPNSSTIITQKLMLPEDSVARVESSLSSRSSSDARISAIALPRPVTEHSASLPVEFSDFERNALNSNSTCFSTASTTPSKSRLLPPKLLATPQSASLGRATMTPPSGTHINTNAFRRSSLGDLKIPARISQAQDGLKRDLNRVREFAFHVDQMKSLRGTHNDLNSRIWKIVDESVVDTSRNIPSVIFNFPLHMPRARSRHGTRSRSNTNPSRPLSKIERHNRDVLVSTLASIDTKYSVAWECAELLIDLGGSNAMESSGNVSASLATRNSTDDNSYRTKSKSSSGLLLHAGRKSRERAITLAGGTSKPADEVLLASFSKSQRRQLAPLAYAPQVDRIPAASWQNSTGKHDLSQRQINLLKVMLNTEPGKENLQVQHPEAEEATRTFSNHWQWGSAMDSTVTLPSEDSVSTYDASPTKKRNSTKLGIVGFRDLLKSLTKGHTGGQREEFSDSHNISSSSVVSSTDDSRQKSGAGHIGLLQPESQSRSTSRQNKSSVGPESVKSAVPQANISLVNTTLAHRPSPRRPSLASLFRLGQKAKQNNLATSELEQTPAIPSVVSTAESSLSLSKEDNDALYSDWDRIDTSSDLEELRETLAEIGQEMDHVATIKGKKKHSNRLSKGHTAQKHTSPQPQKARDPIEHSFWASPPKKAAVDLSAKTNNNGHQHTHFTETSICMNLGSTTTEVVDDSNKLGNTQDFRLILTPNNIKPLLENARDVTTRLTDCIRELELLISAHT